MKEKEKGWLNLVIAVGFACFCIGSILSQHLTQMGYRYISLILGIPAWIISVVLMVVVNRRRKALDRPPGM